MTHSSPATLPPAQLRMTWFTRAWAAAALFHVAGDIRTDTSDPALTALNILLPLSACLTLLRPERRHLAVLCGLTILLASLETPRLGNHWLLAALISLTVLTGVARRTSDAALERPIRATLLIAYAFAASAKLNTDFLNAAVSCAAFYQDQLTRSWGLPALPALAPLAAPVALVTELTVAASLTWRRTRRWGLALACGFHWLLAMNLTQQFWDFSAVLFAAFILFLDDDQTRQADNWLRQTRARPVPPAVTRRALLVLGAVTALLAATNSRTADGLLAQLGQLAWTLYGTAVLLAVLALVRIPRTPRTPAPRPAAALYLAAILAFANGLTPYLELKTAYGWNMYSNLRTEGGVSNHLIVRRTADLTGAQRDLVRVIRTDDPALDRLREDGYALPFVEFQRYARQHPDVTVTYDRTGQAERTERLGDNPDLTAPAPLARLHAFRVIDLRGPQRCLTTFSGAR